LKGNIIAAFLVIFFGFLLVEVALGRTKFKGLGWQNHLLDGLSLLQSIAVIGPIISIGSAALATWLHPAGRNSLIDTPLWLQFIAFLLLDDLVQYWWHRSAHTFKALWPLHRVHHAAPYMGIKIWLRNGFVYYWFMPNLWLSGALIFVGFGKVYVAYHLLKIVVTAAAHSELRWDSFLYKHAWLNPVAWVVERTISTPATHFAHHALHDNDGIGHYKGNFSNLLFLWDVLFGTAVITRRYPPAFGLEEDYEHGTEKWYVQWLYPIFRTSRGKQPAQINLNDKEIHHEQSAAQ
jgi:sterol desaturase/sphingolipid hydroxylase (fatty acid hydroxylase superfamily)